MIVAGIVLVYRTLEPLIWTHTCVWAEERLATLAVFDAAHPLALGFGSGLIAGHGALPHAQAGGARLEGVVVVRAVGVHVMADIFWGDGNGPGVQGVWWWDGGVSIWGV